MSPTDEAAAAAYIAGLEEIAAATDRLAMLAYLIGVAREEAEARAKGGPS